MTRAQTAKVVEMLNDGWTRALHEPGAPLGGPVKLIRGRQVCLVDSDGSVRKLS